MFKVHVQVSAAPCGQTFPTSFLLSPRFGQYWITGVFTDAQLLQSCSNGQPCFKLRILHKATRLVPIAGTIATLLQRS